MKVFELAKELNIGAVDLVNKLRDHGINVRNHMVALSPEEVTSIKKIVNPEVKPKTVIKKAVKKVAAKSAEHSSDNLAVASIDTAQVKPGPIKGDEGVIHADASAMDAQGKRMITVRKRREDGGSQDDVADAQDQEAHATHDQAELLPSLSAAETASNPPVESSTEVREEARVESPEAVKNKNDHVDEPMHRFKVIAQPTPVVVEPPAAVVTPTPVLKEEPPAPAGSKTILRKDHKTLYKGDLPRGLSIVSRPEPVAPTELRGRSDEVQDQSSGEQDDKKGVYREKMHSFTPIFIPKEGKPSDKISTNLSPGKEFKGFDDGEDEQGKSKKRMGDLASMVSKRGAEKKDLGQIRADEELRLASEIVGHVMYTVPKKKRQYVGETKKTLLTTVKDSKRVIIVHGGCSALELSQKLSVKFDELANECLKINLLIDEPDYLGLTLATEIAALYDYRVEDRAFDETKILQKKVVAIETAEGEMRSPIVTIMGHVDHGKTSLLDYIRKAKVAAGEAGGITQHIGAYRVQLDEAAAITFLDTPGHAAFASMRQRGANLTDVVILVVAADDGVMPQTEESIKFIQQAKVPLIVAINKIDKPDAKPEKIKQELMKFGITPEEWGGDTQFVELSALKGTGVDKLLESISVLAQVLELRAQRKGPAECIVIESKVDIGRGPVCTVIVTKGTLKKGDPIVCGESSGRARMLMDHLGQSLNEAIPTVPVQIFGLDQAPTPGDKLTVVDSEREAKKIVDNRISERKAMELAAKKTLNLEDFFKTDQNNNEQGKKILKLVVRADVIGSYEAIKSSLESLGNEEVAVQVISGGVGAISDNDVSLAATTNGYIVGFNMRPITSARRMADEKGVDIKTYTIIYELLDDVRLALEGLLAPTRKERYIGRAQVKEVFQIPKAGTIAGSFVVDGKIERGCQVRLLREGKIIFDGKLSSLRRFKEDVKEVKNNVECGVALENYNDIKVGDLFEAYYMEEVKRTLPAAQH